MGNPTFQPYASGGNGDAVQYCIELCIFRLSFTTQGLTGGRNRVRWVGSLLELGHRRPPGYGSNTHVSNMGHF
jgi:hypothetical protein